MEGTHFDRLARVVGTRQSRRTATALLGSAAAWPLLGRQESDAGKHKKKKKKAAFCLNGQDIEASASKKSKKKLKKKGATPGACPRCTPAWANQTVFASTGTGLSNVNHPQGVTLSSDGLTALVADTSNRRVSVWTRSSASSTNWANRTTFGSIGTAGNQFYEPMSVAVPQDGLTALVADRQNHRITMWTRPAADSATWSSLAIIGSEGSAKNELKYPYDISVSPDGLTAWIVDSGNFRISVWTRPNPRRADWTNQSTFGTEGRAANQLLDPKGVAVSPDGLTVWVADSANDRISVWTRPSSTSAWTPQATFGSDGAGPNNFSNPNRVAVSQDTLMVWVSDTGNNRISVWTRQNANSTAWSNQTTFGSAGAGTGNVNSPVGLTVAPDGRPLLIADADNDRISVWSTPCLK
jgi:tripartite motif-containing protein 71